MTQELKSMYLARRNPALKTRAAYTARWRRHGMLAMSLPFWRHASGYFHCDVLEDPPATADAQFPHAWSTDVDGVGIVFLPSVQDMEALVVHPDFPALLADEWGAFAEPVANFSVLTTEEVHLEARGTAIKMLMILRAAPGTDRETFGALWREHVALVMRCPELTRLVHRYVHDHPVTTAAADDGTDAVRERIEGGLGDVAGIAELGFTSRADMEAYLAHPERAAIREDLARFADLDRLVILATNEVTMDGRPPQWSGRSLP